MLGAERYSEGVRAARVLLFLGVAGVLYVFGAGQAVASGEGWFLNPSFFYYSAEASFQPESTGSGGTETWTKMNVTAGYSMAGGLLLGLRYFSEEKTFTPGGSGNEIVSGVTAAGVSVGFFMEQLALHVAVMGLQAPVRTNDQTEITLSDGSGTILDLMYLADLGGWYLGPQLTWRSFDYKKYEDASNPGSTVADAFNKATETHLEPYITIFITF